jgi:20S proteasome alpha/beta subunit
MGPDFRVLVRKGQKKAQTYYLQYGESIPVLELVREMGAIMQEFTQSGGVRPFGVSLLIAGCVRARERVCVLEGASGCCAKRGPVPEAPRTWPLLVALPLTPHLPCN